MNLLTIFIIVLAVLAFWFAVAFNSLVKFRNRAKEAWSDIDVQLKRRYDLIPNVTESVKGYAAHEKNVFESITNARTRAMGAESKGDIEGVAKAENMLSGALKTLFAVAENYPTLRASENFQKLQEELSDTENKIQAARRFYNSNVLALNNKVEQFPSNFVASMFGFKKEVFFELENEAEKEPVKVSF